MVKLIKADKSTFAMITALFIGRFQPFHNAHLIDIKNAITEVDKLIILIGSSQYKHAPENPFTVEERVLMVQVALHSENIKNCSIFSLEFSCIARFRFWTNSP